LNLDNKNVAASKESSYWFQPVFEIDLLKLNMFEEIYNDVELEDTEEARLAAVWDHYDKIIISRISNGGEIMLVGSKHDTK